MKILILMGSPRITGNTAELCKHSNLLYIGMYSVRDTDNKKAFQIEEAMEGAREYAGRIMRM